MLLVSGGGTCSSTEQCWLQVEVLEVLLRRLEREEADVQRYSATVKKAIRLRAELVIESIEGGKERQLERAEIHEEEVRSVIRGQRTAVKAAVEPLRRAAQGGLARRQMEEALLPQTVLDQHRQRVRGSLVFSVVVYNDQAKYETRRIASNNMIYCFNPSCKINNKYCYLPYKHFQ